LWEAVAKHEYDSEDIVTDLINRAEFSIEEARKARRGYPWWRWRRRSSELRMVFGGFKITFGGDYRLTIHNSHEHSI